MRTTAIILGLAIGLPATALAQQPPVAGNATPLGVRQQHVEQMVADIEQKFKNLKLALQATEPEQADRLQQTLNKTKELLIQRRMADITRLLNEAQLDAATDGQKAILADIHRLLALLIQERSDGDKLSGESLAQLEAYFRGMLADQQRLTAQTAALEKKRQSGQSELSRSDRNALRAIGEDERRMESVKSEGETRRPGLAGQAQQILDGMRDETSVLADAVARLRDSFAQVGSLVTDNLRSDAEINGRQKEIETILERLIEAVKQLQSEQEQPGNDGQGDKPDGQGPGQQRPQTGPSQNRTVRGRGQQGGSTGGGGRGTDNASAAALAQGGPQSPWGKLRDKERDPVYSAIKEKYPSRYQQLIEQYYKSFEDEK